LQSKREITIEKLPSPLARKVKKLFDADDDDFSKRPSSEILKTRLKLRKVSWVKNNEDVDRRRVGGIP